jgi:hypothetical protein
MLCTCGITGDDARSRAKHVSAALADLTRYQTYVGVSAASLFAHKAVGAAWKIPVVLVDVFITEKMIAPTRLICKGTSKQSVGQ